MARMVHGMALGVFAAAITALAAHGEAPGLLPKVLIIGDSISIGYTPPLTKLLEGEAEVVHNPGNARDSAYGLEQLEGWLGDTAWDVIHVNFGLHDLKYVHADGSNAATREGAHIKIPVEDYATNLERIVERLKQTGAALIFATTTPYPDELTGPPRDPGMYAVYNDAAVKVMKRHGVAVNDLCAFALPRLSELQRPNNVHFTEEGSAVLAGEVARHVRAALRSGSEAMNPERQWYRLRGTFDAARVRFEQGGAGRIAFLGGSITQAPGWRDLTEAYFKERFPDTRFTFINAGLASTDSTLGAFRLDSDVLDEGPIDLLFIDFAVNDQANGRTATESVRGMEGIIRQALVHNPGMGILVQYFADPEKLADYGAGRVSQTIAAHERVCEHYGISSNNLAREVTDRIATGEFTWEDDFRDLHPSPFGHELYAAAIRRLFDAAWARPAAESAAAVPDALVDAHSYVRGRMVAIDVAQLGAGWALEPAWTRDDGAAKRPRFEHVPMLEAIEPGAELQFAFEGRAVGLLLVVGPDAGAIEWAIDGGAFKQRDPFTQWSPRLHIPWTLILEGELSAGSHVLTLRTSANRHADSTGHACRIAAFLVS